MTRPNLSPELMKQLRWPLRLTWAAIGLERGWRAFWPLATVGMSAVAWARFVGFQATGFAILGVAVLVTLVWGLRKFHLPSRRDVEARLDQTLPHAPFAALRDLPAQPEGSDASQTLWQAHVARMEEVATHATAPQPNLSVADNDPFALRLMAAVACVMALGFGGVPGHMPIIDNTATASCPGCPVAPSWEGWIEPPAYTGHPSLYLNDQPNGALPVPAGSRLTLRFYGLEDGAVSLSGEVFSGSAAAQMQAEISQDSNLSINLGRGEPNPSWRFSAIGDLPPEIRTNGDLTQELSGTFQQGFVATDDYGVAAGTATINLNLPRVNRSYGLIHSPNPRPELQLDLPRPYRGEMQQIEEVWEENLAQHPWAGLAVIVDLMVEDAMGQTGEARPLHISLPARRFFTREARALIELRRDLLWAREGAARVAQLLRAVSHRPEDLAFPEGSYLALRATIRDLEEGIRAGLTPDIQDRIAQSLWDIALSFEENGLESARDRLTRAQKRLEQAMQDGATPEELAELMDELRRAMNDYLDRLAQMPQDAQPDQQSPNGNGMEMSSADLDAMMDRIEELMREGRMDEAMQMLEGLRRMMENMQVTQGPGEGQNQQARDGLEDTLRQQQGLSDEAFRDLQEQGGQGNQAGESQGNTGRDGGQGRGQSHSGEGGEQGENGQQGEGLASRQRQLQQQLDAQRRALPGVGSEAGNAARDSLGQAGRAMDDAADALDEGDIAGALDRQAEAMEALREGLRRFDEAISQQANREGQQGQTGQDQGNANARDPLGRSTGSQSGRGATDGGFVSEEDMRRRAQELTDELRKRSGETTRPQGERDYFERLLEQF
ncbi:DUF4175 family protein [Aliiroseovarius sp. KMU-50]|uniref:DUF4175 family protein n=1 Tax=Aliiroseovarius salicola TaxID=3009082 RepID=A0ABT4VYB6_9RHOB|nr:DUF4175 family protein [Aliiroseovarius sp. KMU-50]MDA5092567.1 DUF4175 family protein [Aliiroseovarius sp. KMU-50]